MNDTNRVVAHVLDGRVLKGTTRDFFPERPAFHLLLAGSDAQQLIKCDLLKAPFFVKEYAGHAERRDLPGRKVPRERVRKDPLVVFGGQTRGRSRQCLPRDTAARRSWPAQGTVGRPARSGPGRRLGLVEPAQRQHPQQQPEE